MDGVNDLYIALNFVIFHISICIFIAFKQYGQYFNSIFFGLIKCRLRINYVIIDKIWVAFYENCTTLQCLTVPYASLVN